MNQHILLIQNDAMDANAVREALQHGSRFQVDWVRNCGTGLEKLVLEGATKQTRIDAVLVDLFLPDCQGIETFDRLYRAMPQIPILVLSAAPDEDIAKLAVARGAQDYLLKGRFDNYLLPKAIACMLERAAIHDALFEEQERARVTLNSIGDAVISTDVWGDVTYLNVVAERVTGWPREETEGRKLIEVFHIVDASTREVLANPVLSAIRENRTVALTPNCLLVHRDGVEATIEGSAAPIHDSRGLVTGAVIVFHDVTAARALSFRMSYLAHHDALTDLPNRILFNDRLTQGIARAHRLGEKLAVLFLDVDRFKHINDSQGHAVGDRLLQSVSQRLLQCVRSSDTVSRQGGDEFVILIAGAKNARAAVVTAEKILHAMREPHVFDQHELHITVSLGIVNYPDDGRDQETLMKNADFAMYQAKACGRDNYQFFSVEMNVRANERMVIETSLRHALKRGEFMLHYQPKLDLETGAIIGVEALIRWTHPERGLVPPVEFIPVAEESGLIVPIGRWVLREACRQARAWQDAGLPAISIAINVSTVELRAASYVEGVRTALAETGLDPRYVELELTETFLLQDSKSTAVVLHDIKAMGVRLALDDFGTGYSSLSFLKRFPIDSLKIDQSFVRDLTTDADDASIVCAVISMGKSLHMRVVAEGVETPEQLAFLRRQICPEGQGYFFSHPLAADELAKLLSGNTVRASETPTERLGRCTSLPPTQAGSMQLPASKPHSRFQ